jgi:hypothetical protein
LLIKTGLAVLYFLTSSPLRKLTKLTGLCNHYEREKMNRLLLVLGLCALVLASCKPADNSKKYGKELTLKENTQISTILENPDEYVGKKVLVSGMVVDTCPMRGCWIDLAEDSVSQIIRVKVSDGEIVFDLGTKGKNATVEGEVEKLELTKEQLIAWKQHCAEELGQEFDPSTITEGDTIYTIKGAGAVIE